MNGVGGCRTIAMLGASFVRPGPSFIPTLPVVGAVARRRRQGRPSLGGWGICDACRPHLGGGEHGGRLEEGRPVL